MGRKGSSDMGGSNGISFNNESDMTNFELNNSEGWYGGLSRGEKDALNYMATESFTINQRLRDGEQLSDSQKEIVKNMDTAISKNTLNESVEVYRGVGTDYLGLDLSSEASIQKLVNSNTTVTDKGYMATTLSKDIGDVYSRGVVIKAVAPKGKNVGFMDVAINGGSKSRTISASKSGDSNHELAFERNSKLKFTGYTKKSHNGRSYFEISAVMS